MDDITRLIAELGQNGNQHLPSPQAPARVRGLVAQPIPFPTLPPLGAPLSADPVALLQELVLRERAKVARGLVYPFSIPVLQLQGISHYVFPAPAFVVQFVNDGPNVVFWRMPDGSSGVYAKMNPSESISISDDNAVFVSIGFQVQVASGTATIRGLSLS